MRFKLNQVVVGKARPRHHGRQAYMPKPYQRWMQLVVDELKEQFVGKPTSDPVLVRMMFSETGAEIEVMPTSHERPLYNRRSDIDNMAGAVLDAMQHAGIFENDKQVHRLEVWFDDGTH